MTAPGSPGRDTTTPGKNGREPGERPPPDRRPHPQGIGRWGEVIIQAGRDLWANHAMEWAAALSFYALLSFLPLLLAAAAIAARVVDPEWAVAWIATLTGAVLPEDVVDTETIVNQALDHQGQVGLFGILAWLIGGRRILGALITAMNLVSDVDTAHDPVRRRVLVEIAILIGLGLVLVMVLIFGPRIAPPGSVTASVLGVGLLLLGFTVLYSVVPLGKRGRRATLIGAVAATLLFLVARTVFLTFLDQIWASVSLVYGPLAVATVLLLWGWYVSLVALFGGSLASHVKVMLDEGASAEEAGRRHVARLDAD